MIIECSSLGLSIQGKFRVWTTNKCCTQSLFIWCCL